MTERQASNYMKMLVVFLGVIVTGLIFIVEKMGTVFQIAQSLLGITYGALVATFLLGMFSRVANGNVIIILYNDTHL